MQSENTINTGGLATTFPRGQPVRAMSEVELLAREAASARRAMDATLREIVGAPPGRDGWRVWAGEHPFLLVSGDAGPSAIQPLSTGSLRIASRALLRTMSRYATVSQRP